MYIKWENCMGHYITDFDYQSYKQSAIVAQYNLIHMKIHVATSFHHSHNVKLSWLL